MGPFEPNQSVTIANSLRRTLLSELYGLAITAVEIEGAIHEYSNLKGVSDSVLDILLNLKHVVLKKTFYSFKPVLGYLRVEGPGKVLASDLRLPPFVQCVDPNHLIANLEHDGVLTMKVLIQYGHKWLSPPNHFFTSLEKPNLTTMMKSVPAQNHLKRKRRGMRTLDPDPNGKNKKAKAKVLSQKEKKQKEKEEKETKEIHEMNRAEIFENLNSLPRRNLKNLLNFHYIKRRFVFRQAKRVGFILSKNYMGILSKQGFHLLSRSYELQEETQNLLARLRAKKRLLSLRDPGMDLRTATIATEVLSENGKLSDLLISETNSNSYLSLRDRSFKEPISRLSLHHRDEMDPLNKEDKITKIDRWPQNWLKPTSKPMTIDSVFNPVNKVNFTIEHSDYKTAVERLNHSDEISEFYKIIRASNSRTFQFFSQLTAKTKKKKGLNLDSSYPSYGTSFSLKESIEKQKGFSLLSDTKTDSLNLFLDYQRELNLLKNNTPKDNILLEIWTNGSLHPRDALNQTFMNLMEVFSKLNEINPFLHIFSHLSRLPSGKEIPKRNKKKWGPALKQIKAGKIETSLIPSLIPVTSESYLATYMTPRFRDFRTLLKPTFMPMPSDKTRAKSIHPLREREREREETPAQVRKPSSSKPTPKRTKRTSKPTGHVIT